MIRSNLIPLIFLVLVASLSQACGTDSSPTTPGDSPAPMASPLSGRLPDLQVAADIIAWNQNEGRYSANQRRQGVITRWEPPVRVRVEPSASRERVTEAMAFWQAATGLSYLLVDDAQEPQLLVRSEPGAMASRGQLVGTYPNNRARSGLAVISTDHCPPSNSETYCRYVYRHEIGHVLAFLAHSSDGLMCNPCPPGNDGSLLPREINFMTALYALPHGAAVESDGSWQVVLQ